MAKVPPRGGGGSGCLCGRMRWGLGVAGVAKKEGASSRRLSRGTMMMMEERIKLGDAEEIDEEHLKACDS